VATDDQGFILTGADAKAAGKGWGLDRDPLMFETNVPGIFAAGDVRANANRRIAAAVGEDQRRSSRCISTCAASNASRQKVCDDRKVIGSR
jgi:thioredoxin reductase